ncbi:MAG TPA: PEGA domain-containing protein [Vicinamibacterales bacterium]|jgi:hypothetical protein
MSETDRTPVDPAYREQLLAAAKAAAAWGRVHQAGWTGDGPPADRVEPPTPTPAATTLAQVVPPVAAMEPVQHPEPVAEESDTLDPVPEPSAPLWPRLRRLLVPAAALAGTAALIVVLVIGVRSGLNAWTHRVAHTQTEVPARADAAAASVQPPKPQVSVEAPRTPATPVGRLSVTTTPTGAKVSVDGHAYGTTPLLIDPLAAGAHTVVISSRQGIVRRTVRIDDDKTTELSEAITEGWVQILCPFEVTVSENGQPLWLYDNTVKLPAGTHHLRFENQQMNYVSEQDVVVNPGGQTTVSIVPPPTP